MAGEREVVFGGGGGDEGVFVPRRGREGGCRLRGGRLRGGRGRWRGGRGRGLGGQGSLYPRCRRGRVSGIFGRGSVSVRRAENLGRFEGVGR